MTADRPTGRQLVEELRAAAKAAGVSVNQFVQPLVTSNASSLIAQLVRAEAPWPTTVDRVRALIAGAAIPESRRSPFDGAFGATRRYAKGVRIDTVSERAAKQALGAQAAAERRPGETLAEAVARLGREVDEEEAAERREDTEARRARELAELPSPSALIRRAAQDWPQHSDAVAAIATELGVAKGEAWHRVIAAGIDSLREAKG